MNNRQDPRLTPFLSLLSLFLQGHLSEIDLQRKWKGALRMDPIPRNEREYGLLSSLFSRSATYIADPTQKSLRERVQELLYLLEQ